MNANLKKSLVAGSVTVMVIGVLTLVILTLHSCGGGGSDNNSPVYDENGNCLENCGNNEADGTGGCPVCGYFRIIDGKQICMTDNCVNTGDGWVAASDTSCYSDGCGNTPQSDTEPYVCPVKEPPEMCTVLPSGKDPNGYIPECTNSGGENCGLPGLDIYDCICHGGYFIEQSCSTDADCQKVPPDAWPPCVCWDFCGFFGEWDCGSQIVTFDYFPDEGDGLCHLKLGSGEGYNPIGKPGDPNPRFPLDGEPEISYLLSPDGQTLTSPTSGVTCTKMVPAL